jgi:two-component system sensor histidine kinase PilS (NtrC family)
VEVLSSELKLQNENGRLLELIVKESNRLNEILADFLTYARNQRSSFNKVELCHLIGDIFEVTRHHPAYHRGISLELQADDSFAYIYSDEDQLKQILINLMVNACQAIDGDSGEITVAIDASRSDCVVLTLTDNGPGIPEDILQKVFNPFYSTKKDGTGLGLAIVQRLTKLLEIDLWVESSVGGPTSFTLTFTKVPDIRISLKAPEKAGAEV